MPQGRVGVRCFVPSTSCTCAQACERWLPLGNCSVGQPPIVGRDLGQPPFGEATTGCVEGRVFVWWTNCNERVCPLLGVR